MRLLFIRHGDPDYEHDTLTEKGHREAKLLSCMASDLRLGTVYQSPLGRAQVTASYSLEETGLTAKTCSWLREFPAAVDINRSPELQYAYPDCKKEGEIFRPRIVWDMLPGYWTTHPEYLDRTAWRTSEAARCSNLTETYDSVKKEFLELLAAHGYRKGEHFFHAEKANEDTLTFFCHFGITCVLLSILWDISPFLLWHDLVLAPTSVTELVTEEREQGIAVFRALRLGDTAHLALAHEPASFAARFCETYAKTDQRH
ncbi:MAG: histidine phosphatase family protein [Blautia sp.]|nr:histidine phosphatase family protein [Blautia sp.]